MTIRVIVVDDSATMRGLISATLRADPEIEVVGQAADANEARAAIKALQPDVITLDIEMPHMNGLDFLEKIMRLRPMPVVMVSTLTHKAADISIRAMEMGAFDCVAKPHGGEMDSFATLAEKVKAASHSRMKLHNKPAHIANAISHYAPDGRIIAIGSSTGGVESLLRIIPNFPKNCPPTLITQHMPATFTKRFAERLDRESPPTVVEASDGCIIQTGHVYLAPGDSHLEVARGGSLHCVLNNGARVNNHRPSVDVMFRSIAKLVGNRAIGVSLTGMGADGAEGLLAMRRAGADTLGQDEATSLVYGMPRVAFEVGAVAQQLPIQNIAQKLLQMSNMHSHERQTA